MKRLDYYNDYEQDRYFHYVFKETGQKIRKTNRFYRDGILQSVNERNEIPCESCIELDMSLIGDSVIGDVLNGRSLAADYIHKFWTHIFGVEVVALYCYMIRQTDSIENDFFCKTIADISCEVNKNRTTITKYIQLLQTNKFIQVFYRQDKKQNKKDTSPLFKLRNNIPLLSSDQVALLPERIKKEHEDFLSKAHDCNILKKGKFSDVDLYKHTKSATTQTKSNRSRKAFVDKPSPVDKYKYDINDPSVGCVYVLKAEDGLVKVGTTNDMHKRLKQLKLQHSGSLDVLDVMLAKRNYELESLIHRTYQHKRVRGEWFNLDEEDILNISDVIYTNWVD